MVLWAPPCVNQSVRAPFSQHEWQGRLFGDGTEPPAGIFYRLALERSMRPHHVLSRCLRQEVLPAGGRAIPQRCAYPFCRTRLPPFPEPGPPAPRSAPPCDHITEGALALPAARFRRRYWEERVASLERQLDHYRAVEVERRRGGDALPVAVARAQAQPQITRVDVPLVPPIEGWTVHPAEARTNPWVPTVHTLINPRLIPSSAGCGSRHCSMRALRCLLTSALPAPPAPDAAADTRARR